jgi:transposase-like protein
MARQRSHSIEFKRQVAQEFIAGESLYALSKRHDISRQLIRVWVEKYEAGALDEDAQAAASTPTGSKLSTTAVLHRCRGHLLIIPAALLYAGPLSK